MKNGVKGLIVYQKSYKLAMKIFELTKSYPKEERYSLTDQVRRSSRSICSNIGEAYRKRIYPKHFRSKITDADSECTETIIWLDFSFDCNYINKNNYKILLDEYEQVGKMLGKMIHNPEKFTP